MCINLHKGILHVIEQTCEEGYIINQNIESRIETRATAELQKEIERELNSHEEEKTVASLLEIQKNKEEDLGTTGKCD